MSFPTGVTLDGSHIHYAMSGSEQGPLIVLVHSLGTDMRLWQGVCEHLNPHYKVLRYDLPGHGLSAMTDRFPSLDQLGDQLARLIEHCGGPASQVCGISAGGLVVMNMARHYPELTHSIALSNTSLRIGSRDFWKDRIKTVQDSGLKAIAPDLVSRWFSSRYLEDNPEATKLWEQLAGSCSIEGYCRLCDILADGDASDWAGSIEHPALCIAGQEDLATPPSDLERLAKVLPRSRYVMIKEAGHLPCAEAPEHFASLLISQLKEHAIAC